MFASTKTAHGEVAFEGSGGPPDFTAHDVEYLARDGSAHRIDQPGGRAWAFTHEAPPGAILGKLVAKRS